MTSEDRARHYYHDSGRTALNKAILFAATVAAWVIAFGLLYMCQGMVVCVKG